MKRITIEVEENILKSVKAHVIEYGYKSIRELVLKALSIQMNKDIKKRG